MEVKMTFDNILAVITTIMPLPTAEVIASVIWFLKENVLNILQFIIIPLITVIWTKKTICLSSADDVIKLKEYKAQKRDERRKNNFYRNLYIKCYRNQKKYKGWYLCDFQEFGNIEDRWFRVTNKNGEYLTIGFPQNMLVRRYSHDPNDRSTRNSFMYKPNFIEQFFCNLKLKKEEKIIEKAYPLLVSILEEKKSAQSTIEINELYKNFENMKYKVWERMLSKLKEKRNDLAELITILQLGKNAQLPMFKSRRFVL
jgi:hypothetical protein